MKKGTTGHPKTKALARALNVQLPTAIGILQLLWEFTGDYAPDGAIGKFSDAYIAEECHWSREPDVFINALVEKEWVDRDPLHRLIIHDWFDHCEDTVHSKIARAKRHFATGQAPKLSRLSRDERAEISQFYQQHPVASARDALESARDVRTPRTSDERTPCALDVRTESARDVRTPRVPLPSLALPSLALPSVSAHATDARTNDSPPPPSQFVPGEDVAGKSTFRDDIDKAWQWLVAQYPGEVNAYNNPQMLASVVTTFSDVSLLLKNTPLWIATEKWQDVRFVPSLENYLKKRQFKSAPRIAPQQQAGTVYKKVLIDKDGNPID